MFVVGFFKESAIAHVPGTPWGEINKRPNQIDPKRDSTHTCTEAWLLVIQAGYFIQHCLIVFFSPRITRMVAIFFVTIMQACETSNPQ